MVSIAFFENQFEIADVVKQMLYNSAKKIGIIKIAVPKS